MYRLIPLLIAHISPKWYNKKIEKVQSTFHMDIKNKIQTILNNKNFYLGVSAAVTIIAVVIMAIYFGSGSLFKGFTPLTTYKCAANPDNVSAGQQNKVTWSAYNILPLPNGTKVASIFENLGTTSVSTNDFKDYYAIYPANTPAGTITATAHINSTTSVTCQLKINPVQYPECTPGQTTQQTCPNGTDKKTSTCGSEGYWAHGVLKPARLAGRNAHLVKPRSKPVPTAPQSKQVLAIVKDIGEHGILKPAKSSFLNFQ